MSSIWRLRLLGQFSLDRDGEPIEFFGARKEEELLALLVLGHTLPLPRDELAATIWPGVYRKVARKNLSYNLFVLKKRLAELGAPELILDAGSRALRIAPGISADLWEFNEAVAAATADPARTDALERAISLYNGGLLPQHDFRWVEERQTQVRQRFDSVVELFQEVASPSPIRRDLFEHLPSPAWRPAPPIRDVPPSRELLEDLRALAIGAESGLLSSERTAWLEKIDTAWPQVEELIARALRSGDTTEALDIASRMWRYWLLRGDIASGWQVITKLFANPSAGGLERRARAYHALGMLASYQGDHDIARHHLDGELAIWRDAEDHARRRRDTEPALRQNNEISVGLLRALTGSAIAYYNAGAYELASTAYDQALSIARALGDRDDLIRLLYNRALVALKDQDALVAQRLLHERLSILEASPEDERQGATHAHLASAYMLERDDQRARSHAQLALESLSEDAAPNDRIVALQILGRIAHNDGELGTAIEHFRAALGISHELDSLWWVGSSMRFLALALRDAGEHDEAERHAANARQLLHASGAADELQRFETAWDEGAPEDPLA